MKFNELNGGEWFLINEIRYMKIDPPIEDKWGNIFVAVSSRGRVLDSEDIKSTDDVIWTR